MCSNFLCSKQSLKVKKCQLGTIVLEGPSTLQMRYYFAKYSEAYQGLVIVKYCSASVVRIGSRIVLLAHM